MTDTTCELCSTLSERILIKNPHWRIIDVADPQIPGFTRLISNQHVQEMTDLPPSEQIEIMQAVLRIEKVMREQLNPHKINLASLGNQVAHLHWHIIPRWRDDFAYPAPIWSGPIDATERPALATQRATSVRGRITDYHEALINEFSDNS